MSRCTVIVRDLDSGKTVHEKTYNGHHMVEVINGAKESE